MDEDRAIFGGGCLLGLLLLVIIVGFLSFKTVPTGNVGILTTWGAADPHTLGQGGHFVLPFAQDVKIVNVQVTNHAFDKIGAASKELQNVYLTGTVTYYVDSNRAAELYSNVGLDYEAKIIDPYFRDYIKEIVPTYSVYDILGARKEIRDKALALLQTRLSTESKCPGCIIITDVPIKNIDFDKSFNDAIEAKQVASQKVQEEQQILEQKKVQAQQAVVTAQGNADANRILESSINSSLLEYLYAKKFGDSWDGKLPLYVGAGANVLIPVQQATPTGH